VKKGGKLKKDGKLNGGMVTVVGRLDNYDNFIERDKKYRFN
jgi:hypothetical protein